MFLPNGVIAWELRASKYTQEEYKNVNNYLEREYDGRTLDRKVRTPFINGCRLYLDTSPELNEEKASFYHLQIVLLRWIVELGPIYITNEVSLLSSHLALPRGRPLKAAFRTFSYLKFRHSTRLVLEPSYATIDMDQF